MGKSHSYRNTPAGRRALSRVGRAALAAAAALLPSAASACPACYGSASGPVIAGMNLAVLVMIGITGGVLSWIIAFAVRIVRRERHVAPPEPDGTAGRDRGDDR
jgi:heme/copper-type cytochrome/quinol oxidase subunit 2